MKLLTGASLVVVLAPVFTDIFEKYPPVAYAIVGVFDHQRCEEVDPAITEELIPDIHAKVTERLESGHPTGTIYYGPPYSKTEFYQGVSEKNQRIARELGLTLHDFRSDAEELGPDIMRLERDLYSEEERSYGRPSSERSVISVDEYFKITKEFLEKYGVSLEFRHSPYHRLSDEGKDKIYDYEKMVQDNDIEAKHNLYGLITFFNQMPEELVRAIGLETIYLYNDRDFESPTDAFGLYVWRNDPGSIYLNNAASQTANAVHAPAAEDIRLVEYILAATAPAPAKATPDQNTSE